MVVFYRVFQVNFKVSSYQSINLALNSQVFSPQIDLPSLCITLPALFVLLLVALPILRLNDSPPQFCFLAPHSARSLGVLQHPHFLSEAASAERLKPYSKLLPPSQLWGFTPVV